MNQAVVERDFHPSLVTKSILGQSELHGEILS